MKFREAATQQITKAHDATNLPRWICAVGIFALGAVILCAAIVLPWLTVPWLRRQAAKQQADAIAKLYPDHERL